jgi:hypothetical protein
MNSYLEGYGAGEEKRERLWKRLAIALVVVLVAAGTLYYLFRNYREERQAKQFFQLLSNKQFKEAYALWGCTDAAPCRDYNYDRFLEDWGPNSIHSNTTKMKVVQTKSCSGGVIQVLRWEGSKDEVFLWVNRPDLVLSFAPWGAPVCSPSFRPSSPAGR